MKGTPQQVADKWASRLSGATAEITAGIDRVTVAPGQKAAAKADKWLMNVQQAADKWKTRVASVTLEDWKAAAKGIGVQRVAAGATAKKGKFSSFLTEFSSHLDALDSKLQGMPDTTFEQRLARMVAAAQHNHTFKRSSR
jgi:hypothetical protein